MRITVPLMLLSLALPATAQIKVSVQALNNAGVALDKANSTRVVATHAANTPFTTYARQYIYEANPYAYLMSYVYPPFSYSGGITYNRVMLTASAYARKQSGHKSLHTTGTTKGDPGTQKYRITLTSTKATKVNMDFWAYGYVYDASSVALKFTDGTTTKSYAWTKPAYNYNNGQLTLNVNGTLNIDVDITGQCKPGTGTTGGNAYYDGFYAYLNCNFVETGNGSFTTFGTGCGTGTISAAGTPTKGSYFSIDLKGAPKSSSAALLWGTSKDYYQFLKLPLDLSYMGAKGCYLNVSFYYPWYRNTDASGNASAGLYLPWYTSGTYYAQWLVWDPKNPSAALPQLTKGAAIKF